MPSLTCTTLDSLSCGIMLSVLFRYLHNFSFLFIAHYIYILILALPILFLIYTQRKSSSNTDQSLPPSPPSIPLLGHLHSLSRLPHRSLHNLSSNYGPIMYLRLGCMPTVILSSASAVQKAIRFHDKELSNRPHLYSPDILVYGSSDVAFSPYGEYWRQARRICVLHLLSNKRVQSFGFIREQEVSALINKIKLNNSRSDGVVNLSQMLYKLTNDIISQAALGQKFSDDGSNKARYLLNEFTTLVGTTLIGEHIPCLGWMDKLTKKRMGKTAKGLDSFLETIIEEHVKVQRDALRDDTYSGQREGSDLLGVLLNIQQIDKEIGISLSRNNIKAIIEDMFIAGTDTIFTTIEWTIAELIKNPVEMKRVQQEVRSIVCTAGMLTEDLVEKMIYLNAAIKESLRLHPPLPLLVPRESTKDIDLMGYHIPARTQFIINAWAIGRDPDAWERAAEFMPERFLGSNVDYKGLHFGLVPFGVGRRICPGISFAASTIGFTISSLLYHFDFDLPDGMKGAPLDMSETNGIAVHKKLNLILEARPYSV